jgi:tetratricopeptide (TPR) repeat protein
MKRSDRNNQDNIILFPDLEKRLMEKGVEKLQQKKYNEAIHLFSEAKTLAPENSDIQIGLILAYFESGNLREAKLLAKEMLKEGIGDYFRIVELYISILVQMNEYEEIAEVIQALMEEKEIPPEKYEHFSKMLHLSKKMTEGKKDRRAEEETVDEWKDDELNLFSSHDPKEQMLKIVKLSKQNIRPYIEEIKSYFISEEGHPFIKTMLLNILKEQEYAKEVRVNKFGNSIAIVPVELTDVREQNKMNEITNKLKDRLENEDPVLFENIHTLIERHFFLMYPFELGPADPSVWAAAYHFIGAEYFGAACSVSEFAIKYHASTEEITKALRMIREVEEISYPII